MTAGIDLHGPAGWHAVRLEDCPLVPWRNGAGVGRDLLHWPGVEDTQVRISVAEIERDAPFSSYPGIQRHFALIAGAVRLRFAGRNIVLRRTEDVAVFDGAEAPACMVLDGPARALNFMVRSPAPLQATPNAQLLRVCPGVLPPAARLRAIYAEGTLRWTDDPDAAATPPPTGAWLMTFEPQP